MPKPENAKRRQACPSEPQPLSLTKTTDVALTLAGSPTAQHEADAQQTYPGSAAAAGSFVDWTAFLRRVFDVSALECRRCGGTLRFISTNIEESAITKLLDSLGLASSPPLRRARTPAPQLDFDRSRPWPSCWSRMEPGSSLRATAVTDRRVFASRSLHTSALIPSRLSSCGHNDVTRSLS